jgi:hypothetical protein
LACTSIAAAILCLTLRNRRRSLPIRSIKVVITLSPHNRDAALYVVDFLIELLTVPIEYNFLD